MHSAVNQTISFYGIEGLLSYFRVEGREFLQHAATLEAAVDLIGEETDLILIPTTLEGDWYRTAAGPLLVRDQDGIDLAVLPDWRGRYYFRDKGTGRRVYITEQNCRRFPTAYSVTRDLSGSRITAAAVVGRMLRELSWYEGGLLLLWGVLCGGFGVVLAEQVHRILASVILTADQSAFWRTAASILVVSLLEILLVLSGRQVVRRVSQKGALAVLTCIGRRLYLSEHLDEAAGAAAGLAALRDSGERVMSWLLSALWGFLTVLVILLALPGRSAAGFASAGLIALVLYAAAAAVYRFFAGREVDGRGAQERREWLSHRAADRWMGVDRPLPRKWNRRRPDRLWGASWPVATLLGIPVVYFMIAGGHSAARLVQTMLLYLPAVVLPLGVLLDAERAGRSMAEIRALLPLGEAPSASGVSLPSMGSVFELKDVTFAYPGREEPVLQQVNLRLHPGEVVGIFGATGSGKTTLARLMTGLERPAGGTIYYGGIELSRFNGSALRRRVAWERGDDIVLCSRVPEERDGRTYVVFSAREAGLEGCDRILRLSGGRMTQE